MKYQIQRTTQFKKDYKLAKKRGLNLEDLKIVIEFISNGKILPEKYCDHLLQNSKYYKNMRECHINPDWLLIHRISEKLMILSLQRTGSHSDLFKK